jgi:hypothetical protein
MEDRSTLSSQRLSERDYQTMCILFGFHDWRKFREFVFEQEAKRQANVQRRV